MSPYGKSMVEMIIPALIKNDYKIITGRTRGINEMVERMVKKFGGNIQVLETNDGFEKMNTELAKSANKLLVIEGGENSGTILVAKEFLDRGKEVWAVPGRVGDPNSVATNFLIKNGAMVFTDVSDII